MPEADATPAPTQKPHTLDDLMIAMDVVDTVRHREDLVARELSEPAREAELIERLREVYRQQGIEVPDSVLAEGVKALKESRFTYTPKPPSWQRTAFELWTRRVGVGSIAGGALAVLLALWGWHYFTVTRPAELAEQTARVEITETLPNAIHKAGDDVLRAATAEEPKARARQLLADGERAIRDRDKAAMEKAAADLARLRTDVLAEYTLTIVSRPGEPTGVTRHPNRNPTATNYYIVVEAVAQSGARLKLPIRNEETGAIDTVDKFALRVPKATFDAIGADKRDDGIVQRNRFGVKRRGTLDVEYLMPFEGGMLTKW